MSVEIFDNDLARISSEGRLELPDLQSLFSLMEKQVLSPDDNRKVLDDGSVLARLIVNARHGVATESAEVKGSDTGGYVEHFSGMEQVALSPALRVRLVFWRTFVEALLEGSPLDHRLLVELQRLRPVLIALALRDQAILVDANQPVQQFLHKVLHEGATWYPESGKEGAVFFDALEQVIDEVCALACTADIELLSSSAATFTALVDKQITRATMMQKRCSESELGMAKIHSAQQKVIFLLDSLKGCSLPETVVLFIRNVLRSELQFILINQSEAAGAWQSWIAVIKRLPQVFPPVPEGEDAVEPEPPNRQQLYRDVQIIVSLLDEHVTVSAAQQRSYDEGVEDLRERLFEKLRGVNVPLIIFSPLSVPDELSRLGAAISPSLLKKVAGLKAGDWFLFTNDENQVLRCKLLLRPPEIGQLLFVNRSGYRVLQKSVQDFSACLATRIAIPLVVKNPFAVAMEDALKKIKVYMQKLRALKIAAGTEAHTVEKRAREVSCPPAVVSADVLVPSGDGIAGDLVAIAAESGEAIRVVAPPGDPAVDRKSAGQKALQEARVFAKLEIRRKRTANRPEASTASAPESVYHEDVHKQVASLNPGAWMELPRPGSETLLRCKLVAIMRSSDTFIFADRHGTKVAEYDRAALVSLIADECASIISSGDDFEGQLSRVVLTLRRDI